MATWTTTRRRVSSAICASVVRCATWLSSRARTCTRCRTLPRWARTRSVSKWSGASKAISPGWTPWSLLHPSAQIGDDVAIGPGTLLAPNTIVTTRVRIGRHCILNVKVSVSHDTEVGDFVNLNPGVTVCGKCRIGIGPTSARVRFSSTACRRRRIHCWRRSGRGSQHPGELHGCRRPRTRH